LSDDETGRLVPSQGAPFPSLCWHPALSLALSRYPRDSSLLPPPARANHVLLSRSSLSAIRLLLPCTTRAARAPRIEQAPRRPHRYPPLALPLVTLPFSRSWRTIVAVSVLPSSLSLAQLVLRVRRVKYASYASFLRLVRPPRLLSRPLPPPRELISLPPTLSRLRVQHGGDRSFPPVSLSFLFLVRPVPLHPIRQTPGGLLRLTKAWLCQDHGSLFPERIVRSSCCAPAARMIYFLFLPRAPSTGRCPRSPWRPRAAITVSFSAAPFRYTDLGVYPFILHRVPFVDATCAARAARTPRRALVVFFPSPSPSHRRFPRSLQPARSPSPLPPPSLRSFSRFF